MKREASKKSKLWLWLVIGLVVLAAAGAAVFFLMGGFGNTDVPEETEAAAVSNDLYWNVDKATYTQNSQTGLSTRTPGEDGQYKVRFAYNGELVEKVVADKQLINYIDTLDAMGLVFDGDGVVIDVVNPKDIAKELAKNAYVKSTMGDTIVANTSVAMNGMAINIKVTENTGVYDVTPEAEVPGQAINVAALKPMDTLTVYADKDTGDVRYVFVTSHARESKVYWRADQFYNSTLKETTREPDENGVYTVPFFCEGERVELKFKDKALVTKIDSISRWKCHFGLGFDEEGYVVEQFVSSLGISALIVADCWDIMSIDGEYVEVQRLTTNDGSTWSGNIPADCVIYDVGPVAKSDNVAGQATDGLKVGDRVTIWTDTTGNVILVYVSNRLCDSPAYWSPTKKYSSTKKETTRTIGASGYYEVELVKEGTLGKHTYYIKDKALATYMDSIASKMFGLKVGENNIIEAVYDPETLTGYTSKTKGGIVTKVAGSLVTKISYGKRGTDTSLILAPNPRVYNVSQYGTMGAATTVRAGDHIWAHAQPTGEMLLIFVTKRTIGGNHLYWIDELMWDKENLTSTREPDAEGWYYFNASCQGKQVVLKTQNKELVDKIDKLSIGATALDVNGDIITNVYDATYAYGGNKVASGYKYQYRKSDGSYFCTYASDANKTAEFKMASGCVIYNVSDVYDEFRGEKISSIPKNAMLTVFCDVYGEAKVVFVRKQPSKDMYWKTEILYDSTNKVTKRVPDADGYYWYDLAVNGELKTFKTKNQKVANSMDSYAGAFGLTIKNGEIVAFVKTDSIANVSGNGYTTASVLAVDGNKVTVDYSGKTETMKLSSDCKIYDVSPTAENFGAVAELQVGDVVRTYLSPDKSTHTYVYIKSRPARVLGEVGYCEACDKEVTWKPITNSSAISAADGHWYVPADMTVYVQSSFASTSKDYTICLDMNGKVMTRSENGRNFRVSENETLNIMDSVGGGKIVTGGGTSYNGGMFMITAGGKVNMYGGTLEFVETAYKNGYGGIAYLSGAGSTFNLYDGVITGGISTAHNTDKPAYGGNFYVAANAELNVYGGEISNGKTYGILVEKTNATTGVTTYTAVAAYGGNIYMSESAKVNIYGGVIKDGQAVRQTFGAADGKDYSNMTYGGNIYKVDHPTTEGTLYIKDATVTGGRAHRGGNIMTGTGKSGNIVLDNAIVSDGLASQFGGNIMSIGGNFTVQNGSQIIGGACLNAAGELEGNGGNIYSQGGVYTFENATVSGGSAKTGGNIYLYPNKTDLNTVTVKDGSLIEGGTANSGRNIYIAKKNYDDGVILVPTLNVEGGKIVVDKGEAIYSYGHMNLTGGQITGGDVVIASTGYSDVQIGSAEITSKITVKGTKQVTLSGAPKLSQLVLESGVLVTVGELEAGASIKVAANGVFTTPFDMAEDYLDENYFVASKSGEKVNVSADNELMVGDAAAAIDHNKVYEQAKAMDFSAGGTVVATCPVCGAEVEWNPLPANTGTTSNSTLASGHYYLSADIDYTQNKGLYSFVSKQICINLNGQTLISSARAFYTEKADTVLNMMGDGTVSGAGYMGTGSNVGKSYGAMDLTSNANFYGGTYISTGEGAAIGNRKTSTSGEAVINIYAGTTVVNENPNGYAVYVSHNGSVVIHGGTINGNVYDNASKGITISGNPVINKLDLSNGSKVTIGTLKTGASITVHATGIFTNAATNIAQYTDFFTATGGREITVEGSALAVTGEYVEQPTPEEPEPEPDPEPDVPAQPVTCPHCGKDETEITWTEWNFPTYTKGAITSGHYYLTDDLDLDKQYYLGNGTSDDETGLSVDVVLNLNGFNITSPARIFYVYGSNDLTLFDSVGGSVITGGGTAAGAVMYLGDGGAGSEFMLKNLTIRNAYTGTAKNSGPVITLSNAGNQLTIDGCTIEGNVGTKGGAIYLSSACVLNISDSTIIGGTATESGGAIYLATGTLNMTSGTIESGSAATGNGVYVTTGTVNISGGSIEDLLINNADGTANVSGTAVIGTLELTSGAKINVDTLTTGASIAVKADGVFTASVADKASAMTYITSAVAGKVIVEEEGQLAVSVLVNKGNEVYEQAKAMDFSAGGTVTAKCPVCDKEVAWNVMPAPTSSASTALAAGHYYVAEDMEVSKFWYIAANTNGVVCVNLNGKTITNNADRVFYAENAANTLNLMGEGTVIGTGKYNATNTNYVGVLDFCTYANLYGGTYSATNGSPILSNRGSGAQSVVNIYEGTQIIRTEETAIGFNVYISDNGKVNMYGGRISGGSAEVHPALTVGAAGGNILMKVNLSSSKNYDYDCEFNMYGGIVENGSGINGGNIAAIGNMLTNPSATINLMGGTVANGNVIAWGDNGFVKVSGDVKVDCVDMTYATNLMQVGELYEGAKIVVVAEQNAAFTEAVTGDYAKYFFGTENHVGGYVLGDALALAPVCPHCNVPVADIQWIEIGEIGENYSFAESGHYKLTQEVTNTKSNIFTMPESKSLAEGLDIVLDTCGYNVTSVGRVVYVNKYNQFTIYDSVGTTVARSISKTAALGGSGIYVHQGAICNVYDITLYGSPDAHGNGNALSVYGSGAVLNVYSGTFYGNDDPDKAGKLGGVVYNRAGILNIYGGTFGTTVLAADAKGDCVYNASELNIYGGEFGGEIYIDTGATYTVDEKLDLTDKIVDANA